METPGNTAEQNQTSETGEVKLNTTCTRQANIRINNTELRTKTCELHTGTGDKQTSET